MFFPRLYFFIISPSQAPRPKSKESQRGGAPSASDNEAVQPRLGPLLGVKNPPTMIINGDIHQLTRHPNTKNPRQAAAGRLGPATDVPTDSLRLKPVVRSVS